MNSSPLVNNILASRQPVHSKNNNLPGSLNAISTCLKEELHSQLQQRQYPRTQPLIGTLPSFPFPSNFDDLFLSSNPVKSPTQNGVKLGAYTMYESIGKGSFGKVYRGMHNSTGERVAIKILNRIKLQSAKMGKKIAREIHILRLFHHPNICRLYDVIETPTDIFLIQEYIEGGELYDYIVNQGQLKEDAARYIFQQLICALEYCHHFRVCHRDLKPENILLCNSNLQIKIIDFGLSNLMRDGEFLATSCGSPNYAAPEVISGKLYVGPEIDVWSCGVILYTLLCGCFPFDEETIPELFKKVKKGIYEIPSGMCEGARDLIKQLLVVNPVHRLTVPQIRDNIWFNAKLPNHLLYSERQFISEEERIDNSLLQAVARMLKVTLEEVKRQIKASSGDAYVSYNILANCLERSAISSIGASIQAGKEAPGPRVSANERELNLGLVLSVTPAIEALLDEGDANTNKRAYNIVIFTPASEKTPASVRQDRSFAGYSCSNPNKSNNPCAMSLPAGNSYGFDLTSFDASACAGSPVISKSTVRFSLTRNANKPSREVGSATSFYAPPDRWIVKCSSSSNNSQQQLHIVGGGNLDSPRNPNNCCPDDSTDVTFLADTNYTLMNLASFSTSVNMGYSIGSSSKLAQSQRVGSVAFTEAVYDRDERAVTLQNNLGWRVGIMTEQCSKIVMSAVYKVALTMGMCWKVLSPHRIALRYYTLPGLGEVCATGSVLMGGFVRGPTTTVITPPSCVIVVHLFRLHDEHNRGYIMDFSVKRGFFFTALDVVRVFIEQLLTQLD